MRWGWQQTLAVVGALLVSVLQQELFDWCFWLAKRLVRRAARSLPEAHRQRYEEEWLAELDELRGRNVSALVWALWVVACAPSVSQSLQERQASPYRLLRNGYIAAVVAGGLGFGGWLLTHGGLQATQQARGSFLLLLLVATVVQLRRHYLPLPHGLSGFTAGSAELALVVGWGMAAGAPAAALAIMIGDLGRRRSVVKVVFNGGQYMLGLAAAGWVCSAIRPLLPSTWGQLLAIAAAGVVFTTLNSLLVRVLFGLCRPNALGHELREGWVADGLACLTLILVAPFLLLALDHSTAFLPLVLLPEVAVLILFRRLRFPASQEPPPSSVTT
jgi:hypothetical protein